MPLLCYHPGIISGTMLTSESLEERWLSPSSSSVHWDQALRPFIWVKLLPLRVSHLPSPFSLWLISGHSSSPYPPTTYMVFFCLLLGSFHCHFLNNHVPESCVFFPLFTLCSSPGILYLFSESTIAYLVWTAKINVCLHPSPMCHTPLFPATCYWTFFLECLISISA